MRRTRRGRTARGVAPRARLTAVRRFALGAGDGRGEPLARPLSGVRSCAPRYGPSGDVQPARDASFVILCALSDLGHPHPGGEDTHRLRASSLRRPVCGVVGAAQLRLVARLDMKPISTSTLGMSAAFRTRTGMAFGFGQHRQVAGPESRPGLRARRDRADARFPGAPGSPGYGRPRASVVQCRPHNRSALFSRCARAAVCASDALLAGCRCWRRAPMVRQRIRMHRDEQRRTLGLRPATRSSSGTNSRARVSRRGSGPPPRAGASVPGRWPARPVSRTCRRRRWRRDPCRHGRGPA